MTSSPESSPDRFLPLRPVELHVLLSLGSGPRHGYGVMQDAEARTGEEVIPDVGTLYRALRRMVERGLIEPAEAPEGAEADARRVYYALTPLGREVAAAEARRLSSLVAAARSGGFLPSEGA